MPGSSRRSDRLSQVLRAELSNLVIREISDPHLRDVSITDVQVAKDLKSARVFFVMMGGVPDKAAQVSLNRAVPFFRKRLAELTDVRFVPQLEFAHDEHTENVTRLMQLIETSNKPSDGSDPSEGEPK